MKVTANAEPQRSVSCVHMEKHLQLSPCGEKMNLLIPIGYKKQQMWSHAWNFQPPCHGGGVCLPWCVQPCVRQQCLPVQPCDWVCMTFDILQCLQCLLYGTGAALCKHGSTPPLALVTSHLVTSYFPLSHPHIPPFISFFPFSPSLAVSI